MEDILWFEKKWRYYTSFLSLSIMVFEITKKNHDEIMCKMAKGQIHMQKQSTTSQT